MDAFAQAVEEAVEAAVEVEAEAEAHFTPEQKAELAAARKALAERLAENADLREDISDIRAVDEEVLKKIEERTRRMHAAAGIYQEWRRTHPAGMRCLALEHALGIYVPDAVV